MAPASSVCAAANVDGCLLRVVLTGARPEPWIMARMRERAVGRVLAAGITRSSISGSGTLAGPSSVLNLLRPAENARRDHARASEVVDTDEGNTLFTTIALERRGLHIKIMGVRTTRRGKG